MLSPQLTGVFQRLRVLIESFRQVLAIHNGTDEHLSDRERQRLLGKFETRPLFQRKLNTVTDTVRGLDHVVTNPEAYNTHKINAEDRVVGLSGNAAEITHDLNKARSSAPPIAEGPAITELEIYQIAEDGILNGVTPLATEKTYHNTLPVFWLVELVPETWAPVSPGDGAPTYTLTPAEAAVIDALRRGEWAGHL